MCEEKEIGVIVVYPDEATCTANHEFKSRLKLGKCTYRCTQDDKHLQIADSVKKKSPGSKFKVYFIDKNGNPGVMLLQYFGIKALQGLTPTVIALKTEELCKGFRVSMKDLVKSTNSIKCIPPVADL
jgi:hypothetical protein